jgi:hypothetical protein
MSRSGSIERHADRLHTRFEIWLSADVVGLTLATDCAPPGEGSRCIGMLPLAGDTAGPLGGLSSGVTPAGRGACRDIAVLGVAGALPSAVHGVPASASVVSHGRCLVSDGIALRNRRAATAIAEMQCRRCIFKSEG